MQKSLRLLCRSKKVVECWWGVLESELHMREEAHSSEVSHWLEQQRKRGRELRAQQLEPAAATPPALRELRALLTAITAGLRGKMRLLSGYVEHQV